MFDDPPWDTPNPFVMECHPTVYHPTLIRNILIIIWLKPKRCNSFNFPFIRGQVEKKNANCRFRVCPRLMTPVGTPNPFVMECHPTDYHPTLIRNILIIIWLKPKTCYSFNFSFIRGQVEKKCKLPISGFNQMIIKMFLISVGC